MKRTVTRPSRSCVRIKPDAFVHVGAGDYEWLSFFEVDMGTQSPNTIMRKLDADRSHWASGREVAQHGVFPWVVFLVPDDARRQQLVDVAARQPAEAWSIFQVVEFDQAVSALIGQASRGEGSNRPRS